METSSWSFRKPRCVVAPAGPCSSRGGTADRAAPGHKTAEAMSRVLGGRICDRFQACQCHWLGSPPHRGRAGTLGSVHRRVCKPTPAFFDAEERSFGGRTAGALGGYLDGPGEVWDGLDRLARARARVLDPQLLFQQPCISGNARGRGPELASPTAVFKGERPRKGSLATFSTQPCIAVPSICVQRPCTAPSTYRAMDAAGWAAHGNHAANVPRRGGRPRSDRTHSQSRRCAP